MDTNQTPTSPQPLTRAQYKFVKYVKLNGLPRDVYCHTIHHNGEEGHHLIRECDSSDRADELLWFLNTTLSHDDALHARVEELEQEQQSNRACLTKLATHFELLGENSDVLVDRVIEHYNTVRQERDEWKRAAQLNNGIYEPLQQ